jgi:hypothetical protein
MPLPLLALSRLSSSSVVDLSLQIGSKQKSLSKLKAESKAKKCFGLAPLNLFQENLGNKKWFALG